MNVCVRALRCAHALAVLCVMRALRLVVLCVRVLCGVCVVLYVYVLGVVCGVCCIRV